MQVLDVDVRSPKVLNRGTPPVADIGYYCSHGLLLQGKMFRRSAIPEGGFLYDPDNLTNFDFIHQAQLGAQGKIGFIDEVLGLYRIHPENYTNTRDADQVTKILNGRIQALEYLKQRSAITDHEYRMTLQRGFWDVCEEHLRKGNMSHFSDVIDRAMQVQLIDIQADLDYKQREMHLRYKF